MAEIKINMKLKQVVLQPQIQFKRQNITLETIWVHSLEKYLNRSEDYIVLWYSLVLKICNKIQIHRLTCTYALCLGAILCLRFIAAKAFFK